MELGGLSWVRLICRPLEPGPWEHESMGVSRAPGATAIEETVRITSSRRIREGMTPFMGPS